MCQSYWYIQAVIDLEPAGGTHIYLSSEGPTTKAGHPTQHKPANQGHERTVTGGRDSVD
jgi:hypothetical protein